MRAGALGVAMSEEAWVVRKHVGHEKRVAGKSLDLTVTLVIGDRIGAIVGTPRMDLVAMFAFGL